MKFMNTNLPNWPGQTNLNVRFCFIKIAHRRILFEGLWLYQTKEPHQLSLSGYQLFDIPIFSATNYLAKFPFSTEKIFGHTGYI